jgi:hypothetical protein
MKEATALKTAEGRKDFGTKDSASTKRFRHVQGPEDDLNSLRMAVRAAGPSVEDLAGGLANMLSVQRASVVMGLQQTRGNRFVQRAVVQAKLRLGPAKDRYEQETDRVAKAGGRRPLVSPGHLRRGVLLDRRPDPRPGGDRSVAGRPRSEVHGRLRRPARSCKIRRRNRRV